MATLTTNTGRRGARDLCRAPFPSKPQLCAVWRSAGERGTWIRIELGAAGEYMLSLSPAEARYLRDQISAHLSELGD